MNPTRSLLKTRGAAFVLLIKKKLINYDREDIYAIRRNLFQPISAFFTTYYDYYHTGSCS
jgi:hypothetical protein